MHLLLHIKCLHTTQPPTQHVTTVLYLDDLGIRGYASLVVALYDSPDNPRRCSIDLFYVAAEPLSCLQARQTHQQPSRGLGGESLLQIESSRNSIIDGFHPLDDRKDLQHKVDLRFLMIRQIVRMAQISKALMCVSCCVLSVLCCVEYL